MLPPHDTIPKVFALRRSIAPYVAMPVLILLLTPLWISGALQAHDWRILEFFYGGFILIDGLMVWAGLRYRIWWRDGQIVQKAVAGNLTSIRVDEITSIVQETSDVHTLLTFSRPFRRVVIFANNPRDPKYIDVSLKHFVKTDIEKLMDAIHNLRPGLSMPNIVWRR